jgi:hypothetical protein
MTDTTEVREVSHDGAKGALRRIRRILDTEPAWLSDQSMALSVNEPLEEAQGFIRDHLDLGNLNLVDVTDDRPISELTHEELITRLNCQLNYPHLTTEMMLSIVQDLRTIWAYGWLRDEISQIAMELSLCPMHFCDWAACFDDEDDDCAQIRAIFPHGHDT